MTGVIKRLVRDRGFGFIKTSTGVEYFFHRTEAPAYDTMDEGQAVSFEEDPQATKGPRAKKIALA